MVPCLSMQVFVTELLQGNFWKFNLFLKLAEIHAILAILFFSGKFVNHAAVADFIMNCVKK